VRIEYLQCGLQVVASDIVKKTSIPSGAASASRSAIDPSW